MSEPKRRPPKRDIEDAMKIVRKEIEGLIKRGKSYRDMAANPPHSRIDVNWCDRQALADERKVARLMKVWVWMGDSCHA